MSTSNTRTAGTEQDGAATNGTGQTGQAAGSTAAADQDAATTSTTSTSPGTGSSGGEEQIPGAEALGDPGKKALDTMKAERNQAQREAAAAKAELERIRAEQEGRQAEHEAQLAAQKVKDEALAAANKRIALAELKVAAKGRLADPADAATFIDVAQIDVSENGDVDTAAIEALIEGLVTQKPYLAAQGQRFQGSADGGARNDSKPAQLTHEEVRRLSAEGKHDEIVKAKEEGRLADLMKAN